MLNMHFSLNTQNSPIRAVSTACACVCACGRIMAAGPVNMLPDIAKGTVVT